MSAVSKDYKLFFKFLETYTPKGFKEIDQDSPLMIELEKLMEQNDQFIYIADAIRMEILFTSKRSIDMIGVPSENVSFYHFMERTHASDIQRLNIGRAKLLKKSQDIFISGKGSTLMSTNFRVRNGKGKYSNYLMQNYLFFSSTPYKTVFFLKVHTNIDWCKKLKHGYHYYIGNDMSNFRYPDQELLQMGNIFTKREFEIIKLIETGLSTEQISEQLSLSQYTVNTHRGNILKKTEKAHFSELIYDLKERGVL